MEFTQSSSPAMRAIVIKALDTIEAVLHTSHSEAAISLCFLLHLGGYVVNPGDITDIMIAELTVESDHALIRVAYTYDDVDDTGECLKTSVYIKLFTDGRVDVDY